MIGEDIKEGYKITKLGWIPEDWEIIKVSEIGNFHKGKGISKSEIVSEGKPAILYGEIYTDYDSLFESTISFIPESVAEKSKKLRKGDILFTCSGEDRKDIGKALAFIGEDETYAGGDLVILRDAKEDSLYLSYLFNSQVSKKQKYSLAQGFSVVHIYAEQLKKMILPIPSINEQKAIANCLSTWDKAIEKQEALLKAKQQVKQGLMQQLLSGKKRLPGFTEEWKKVVAGKIFKSISIKNKPNHELLSVTQDRGVIPRDMLDGRVTMPSGNLNTFKLVKKGNFVISLRSFQGGLEYSNYDGLVSPAYTVLEEISNINRDFYKYYFKSYEFIERLSTAVIGIRDGKQISYNDFCIVKIPSISVKEQKAIANVLNTADKELEVLNNQLHKLKEQKKGLMQQLLTGKKRLKF